MKEDKQHHAACSGAISPDGSVRRKLLEAAIDLFDRKGYAPTSVSEIVKAAGVTKPVLYYYFRSKEGIFLELMQEGVACFEEILRLPAQLGPAGAREKIARLVDAQMDLAIRYLPVIRIMYSIYYGPPQGAPHFDFEALHHRLRDAVHELVEEGLRSGEFKPGNSWDMTWAVIGAFSISIEVLLSHPEVALGREGLGRILDLVFDGIAAAGGQR
jgi:TetR/AcrR family transcriptional regulator